MNLYIFRPDIDIRIINIFVSSDGVLIATILNCAVSHLQNNGANNVKIIQGPWNRGGGGGGQGRGFQYLFFSNESIFLL